MALDETPGGTSANSYISEADADTYFSTRLHADAWTAATTAQKEAVLQWATRVLDWEAWLGNRTSFTQALRWPRSDVLNRDQDDALDEDTIPAFLEEATCELALVLLSSDVTATPATDGFTEITVDVITLKLDSVYNRPGMLPQSVDELIAPFVDPSSMGSVDVIRS